MMDTLNNIWNHLNEKGQGSDKGSVHSYLDTYEKLLAPYKESNKILEIGIFNGHSLRMWEYYFYNAEVYGVDCSDTPLDGMADLRPMIAEGTHDILIFDATSEAQVKKHFEGMQFNVIIDDAAHSREQQLQLYSLYKHYMAPGGIYIIEDIQDIDSDRAHFENIDPEKSVEIIDLRSVKSRYDDVIVVIK